MVSVNGANSGFENKFREFLQEPETQDAIRKDQAKEIAVMRKMEEMEKLEELQGQREQLAVALQDLPPEAQRVVYPILRLKMVQNLLFATLKETRKAGTSFVHAVRDPALMGMLERMRDELRNDPENAKRIEMEWFHNVGMCAEDKVKKAPKKERGVLPATQMLPIIQSGAQLRVNGNHKFRQGKYKEALEMYMQGCVHVAVRKNVAAAAIKTRDWTVCLQSCDTVLGICPEDTKSLYRRALANWHLGEVEAATTDLESILRRPVSDYSALAESSEVKKLARSMIRQIEASEERAEAMEQRMARALTATIPQDVDERYQDEPELALEDNTEEELPQALRDALRARERALLEESLEEEG
ncbi:hypothetical protein EMIHUDRAFT_240735 [Emiliania huxleyi CCMP1516]|uniref:Uncharacterized protein n=2 Tax=Emiliania huxleyi TaxID=2903 RepID=A0A0D3IVM2_EMIH1|nr:hypothetical protein EMIHUDRAFT_211456 [Emiliania huxleyi CCMP1516]XP_005774399.1 hypothetical protein EMIHUDRAFT_240735 [Emiliania huxleyi CCMP1516]EOD15307.1 hypothetical protein EMIHUDRAFT_211456 [Emiliania huxleyi CCMP1516]EOD21970.1 hypothetical protein EMIHUDRAFT_240735 [Emiliania huxleyi CCMP1516]|eukprot:XP_005767736.1 hypothetical protein EMIHUDRAFT_211456 [Emiliania huxleyi CCMP1516]